MEKILWFKNVCIFSGINENSEPIIGISLPRVWVVSSETWLKFQENLYINF